MPNYNDKSPGEDLSIKKSAIACAITFLFILLTIISVCAFTRLYNVWSSRMEGKAILENAKFTRQVAVQEALAKMDSAKLLADAEIERARGVAQANKIIGDSLKNNDAYLRYLWINNLDQGKNQVIYVPTEANLPILEANRLKRPG